MYVYAFKANKYCRFSYFLFIFFSLAEMRKSAQHMDNVPFSTSVDCDDINI